MNTILLANVHPHMMFCYKYTSIVSRHTMPEGSNISFPCRYRNPKAALLASLSNPLKTKQGIAGLDKNPIIKAQVPPPDPIIEIHMRSFETDSFC